MQRTPHHGDQGYPVALRDIPYPYEAALAITGDLDDLRNREDFLTVARFLATADDTPLGRGIDLEIGHSFWFYDACGTCDFTVFRGSTRDEAPDAPLIEDLIRSGHIDVMHTYGNFSAGGFARQHARWALDYLRDRGLRIEVWVNHGGPQNTQMLGPLPEQRGDDPDAPEYHSDLLVDAGVRFIEKFDITHTVGQDARSGPADRLLQIAETARYWAATGEYRGASILGNRLIEPCTLGDGARVYSLRRFIGKKRGLHRAGSRELAEQLAPSVLAELRTKHGWMAVYTHLWRNPGGAGLIASEAVDALGRLAREHHEGRIYVTTTRKLLALNLVTRGLTWSHARTADGISIRIDSIDDEVAGRWTPAREDLEGITFYTPEPDATRVYAGHDELTGLKRNPPDESGRASVSVPTRRLPSPAALISP
jgi:hypothetical protein